MRFFVRMKERRARDPQEFVAMLYHRLDSIAYEWKLLREGVLAYAFRALQGRLAVEMFEAKSLEDLDLYIKRDPAFPYSEAEVIPVVSTQAMVREVSEYLGESILTDQELSELDFQGKQIKEDSLYWLAWKEVKAFSPLLSQEAQNDVHRRTITSQRAHHAPLEFADDNPVGKAVGILVAEGSLEQVRAHVADCEVYPDTVVSILELVQLSKAWRMTVGDLLRLQRPVPESSPFK